MGAENWMRRASGLVVPAVGFADHPLGRWQPCEGSCCLDPSGCEDCGIALHDPGVWVDLPALNNASCESCADFENSYFVSSGNACRSGGGLVIDPAVCGLDAIIVSFCLVEGTCYLTVRIFVTFGENSIMWQTALASFADPVDHYLPYVSTGYYWDPSGCVPTPSDTSLCSAVGTTVHVYE